jgi:hypothetical protein
MMGTLSCMRTLHHVMMGTLSCMRTPHHVALPLSTLPRCTLQPSCPRLGCVTPPHHLPQLTTLQRRPRRDCSQMPALPLRTSLETPLAAAFQPAQMRRIWRGRLRALRVGHRQQMGCWRGGCKRFRGCVHGGSTRRCGCRSCGCG